MKPASSMLGMLGADARRVLAVTAYALILPARTFGKEFGGLINMRSIWPPTRSCIARKPARDMV